MSADSALLPDLIPDLNAARAFLAALDPRPGAQFGFRTFDDCGGRAPLSGAGVADGGIRQSRDPVKDGWPCRPARLLASMQQLGAGASVVVDQLDGEGQTACNVTRPRACFVDADTAERVDRLDQFVATSRPRPAIIVAVAGINKGVEKPRLAEAG